MPWRSGLAALCMVFFTAVATAEKVVVVTDEWADYTNRDLSGYYFDLLREVYPEPTYLLDFRFVPYARSLSMVEGKEADIVLGIYQGDVPDVQRSKYIVERDLVDALVTPALASNWKGVESLASKKVVAKNGYDFNKLTDVSMDYSEKASLPSMVQMLAAGRVDAVMDYTADLEPLIKEYKLSDDYRIFRGVVGADVYFGFADTANGKQFQQHFDKEFKRLWDAGRVHELMKKHIGSAETLPASQ